MWHKLCLLTNEGDEGYQQTEGEYDDELYIKLIELDNSSILSFIIQDWFIYQKQQF